MSAGLYTVTRLLLLPFFIARLGVVVGFDLARFGFSQLPPLLPLVFSLSLICYAWWSLSHPLSPTLLNQPENSLRKTYQQELDRWLGYYQAQPTHRDVLLNVSALYQALGQPEVAQTYWDKAKAVDPNAIFFTQTGND